MNKSDILKGLWCCNHVGMCSKCPFDIKGGNDRDENGNTCIANLIRAVHEVFRVRVLSLDEIHCGMALWIEYKEKPSWITGFGEITNYKPVTLAIGGASCGGARCFIDEFDRSFGVNDSDYNVRWRAWTQEPTEEQRKAVKWNA